MVKKCFVFYGTQGIFRATAKVYDLSSNNYIEIYTRQLPDMAFEFLNFENIRAVYLWRHIIIIIQGVKIC